MWMALFKGPARPFNLMLGMVTSLTMTAYSLPRTHRALQQKKINDLERGAVGSLLVQLIHVRRNTFAPVVQYALVGVLASQKGV